MRQTVSDVFPRPDAARRRFLKTVLCAAPAFALTGPGAQAAISQAQVRGHLDALSKQFDLKRRFQWTGEPPRMDRLRAATGYTRLTVHHTGTVTNHHQDLGMVAADIANVMTGHRNRRFVIDRAGRVWEGRSLCYIGAHVSSENDDNIGVMLLGNFENQRPSDLQIQTLNRFALALRTRFTIPRYRVYGHCDLGHTLCPGRYLYGYVGNMRTG
jgi:hypothetical protein